MQHHCVNTTIHNDIFFELLCILTQHADHRALERAIIASSFVFPEEIPHGRHVPHRIECAPKISIPLKAYTAWVMP